MRKLHLFTCKKSLEALNFLRFVFRNFLDDDCSNIASTLTFTSLLAIVPLMSVSFALLSSFPVFQELSTPIQNYIFEHFVPATGQVVHQYLTQFTHQVAKLSIWGIVFLFITSVMVMVTIENALNKIWKVRVQRHGTSAFLLYWAILSLTPIMLGLSVAISSYLMSMPIITKELHVNLSRFLSYAPLIISIFCFSFLYIIVPNIKVKLMHALIGASVAAFLLELAKMGFTWYLSSYDTYELLYGAFATVPIFFLWVYWAWFIILLGAEVAYAFSATHYRRTGARLDGMTHSIQWLGYLYHAQAKGKGLTLEALINKDVLAYEVKPEIIIQRLLDAKLITLSEEGAFILCKNLDLLAFDDFRTLLPWRLPKFNKDDLPISNNEQYIKLIKQYQTTLIDILHVPVSSLFK